MEDKKALGGHHHHHASHGEAHAAEEKRAVLDQTEGVIYTCPMHPQVRQIGPGNCPICGMALEPEVVTAETEPSLELIDMRRRFWIGLVLTVPVLALEMGGHLVDLHMLLDPQTSNWLQLVFATPLCSGPARRSSHGLGGRSSPDISTCSR